MTNPPRVDGAGLRGRLLRILRPPRAPAARACPNCNANADGRYCPACGMDKARARLELRTVLADTADSVAGLDSTLGKTLLALVRAPGKLAAEYVTGRRRSYVNPARLALLTLAAWMFLARLLGIDPLDATGFRMTNTSGSLADFDRLRAFFARNFDAFLYLTLPFRALLFQGFFRRSGRNLAESLAMVLYVASFGYLVGLATLPLVAVGVPGSTPLRAALGLIWTLRAALGFYGRPWPSTLWRVLCVAALHAVTTALLFSVVFLAWMLLQR